MASSTSEYLPLPIVYLNQFDLFQWEAAHQEVFASSHSFTSLQSLFLVHDDISKSIHVLLIPQLIIRDNFTILVIGDGATSHLQHSRL